MFTRTVDMLGQEGFDRLRNAFVIVIGLGGVGSHAAQALVRSGIGKLRLIDFDEVSWSSLNRNALATPQDVGQPKVEVLMKSLMQIQPTLEIEPMREFFDYEHRSQLLSGSPDCVIDAIDSVNPKAALLRSCVELSLPVISSMGASARTNPARLRVGDLSETSVCPLARMMRKRLKKFGITEGITTVYSTEAPKPPLPPDEDDFHYARGRTRNRLPSMMPLPGIFGYAIANETIRLIADRQ